MAELINCSTVYKALSCDHTGACEGVMSSRATGVEEGRTLPWQHFGRIAYLDGELPHLHLAPRGRMRGILRALRRRTQSGHHHSVQDSAHCRRWRQRARHLSQSVANHLGNARESHGSHTRASAHHSAYGKPGATVPGAAHGCDRSKRSSAARQRQRVAHLRICFAEHQE